MADAIPNQQALTGPDGRAMTASVGMNAIDTFAQSHTVRHIARLVGLAAAVTIGVIVAMWSSEPNFAPLYTNMSGQDASEVVSVLTANDIDYKLESDSGSILVDQSKLAEARLKVAAQGLPGAASVGLEMLQDDQGLGTSQFIETARYNHALEEELVRSVESIRSVDKARVHLAIPKQSIFIRNRTKPTASVVVKLHSGRVLNAGQVDAIVNLVASSIPLMQAGQVTVIDQFGRLLTEDEDAGMAQTGKQFDYTRLLEESYVDRIINLLQPIVGQGNVNAQVAAQLDFSAVESTREAYDPERSVIRSEQISEEENRQFSQAIGIPGALSNQPPGTGSTEPSADAAVSDSVPANQNRSATRNFEVDRVISHTSNPVGSIQRLSVAVVINDKMIVNDDGSIEKTPYSDEEIERFVSLVRETIGFDNNRGDSISVINTSFLEIAPPVIEEVPVWKSMMQEPWVLNLAKQVLGAIGLLIVYFVFGRPFLRSLNPNRTGVIATMAEQGGGVENMAPMSAPQGNYAAPAGFSNLADDPNSQAAIMRRKDATYDQKVEMARSLVTDDPARVANVMKNWAGDN